MLLCPQFEELNRGPRSCGCEIRSCVSYHHPHSQKTQEGADIALSLPSTLPRQTLTMKAWQLVPKAKTVLGVGVVAEPVVMKCQQKKGILGLSKRSATPNGIREGKRGILSRRCRRSDRSDLNKWLGAQKTQH